VAELWLPVVTGGRVAAQKQGNLPRVDDGPRKLTVLAVDDDRLVLFSTIAMLEDLGHHAIEAISGQQALEILRRDGGAGIDLVLTDQAMPQMTGLQLAGAIQAEWPALPVVLATGYAELPEGTVLPRLGKPFFQEDLARAIRDAIERTKRAG
jgi:CheY-like chemotaxis protein